MSPGFFFHVSNPVLLGFHCMVVCFARSALHVARFDSHTHGACLPLLLATVHPRPLDERPVRPHRSCFPFPVVLFCDSPPNPRPSYNKKQKTKLGVHDLQVHDTGRFSTTRAHRKRSGSKDRRAGVETTTSRMLDVVAIVFFGPIAFLCAMAVCCANWFVGDDED